MTWLAHWLGLDNASGPIYLAWSGVIGTSVIGGVATVLRRLMKRHHAEALAQASQHHRERLAQAGQHHREHLELLRRHHGQQMDAAAAPAPSADGEKLTPDEARKLRHRTATPAGGM